MLEVDHKKKYFQEQTLYFGRDGINMVKYSFSVKLMKNTYSQKNTTYNISMDI